MTEVIEIVLGYAAFLALVVLGDFIGHRISRSLGWARHRDYRIGDGALSILAIAAYFIAIICGVLMMGLFTR